MDQARQNWFAAIVYALSSVALACAFHYIPFEDRFTVGLILQFTPLVVLIPYVRFLLQFATNKQWIIALALHSTAAAAATAYLWNRPDWPPPAELGFGVLIAGLVTVASTCVIATLALVFHHKMAYFTGTVATLLMWPLLLQSLLSNRLVAISGVESLCGVAACFGFAIAAATVFLRPRFAFGLGLLASTLAIPYAIGRELSYPYHGNSWVALNLPGGRFYGPELTYAQLFIFSAVLVVVSAMTSLLRLLPDGWQFRGRPIRSRIWPIFVLSVLVVGVWFAKSASPYRVPTEYGGISAEISIVHLEKRGLHLTERRVSVMRDGRLYTSINVRQPLRYESDGEMFQGSLPSWEKAQQILDFVRSADLKARAGLSREALPQRWKSDTWYVYGERVPLVVFSSAANTAPPKELVDWFNDMNSLPRGWSQHFRTRDVCLGLCYEPRL
jgi:hypothetical protein